jgi:hypothetical protein
MKEFVSQNAAALIALIATLSGALVGLFGGFITTLLSDKRARKRDESSRLFSVRKDSYPNLILLLSRFMNDRNDFDDLEKQKELELAIKQVDFLTSSKDLRMILDSLWFDVMQLHVSRNARGLGDESFRLNTKIRKTLDFIEADMRNELGIQEAWSDTLL